MSQKQGSSSEKVKAEPPNPVSGAEKVDKTDGWSVQSDRSLSYKNKFVGVIHDFYNDYEQRGELPNRIFLAILEFGMSGSKRAAKVAGSMVSAYDKYIF